MVGGGQLARMTYQAAIPLGIRLRLLAQTNDDSAAQVVRDIVVGDHQDLDTLRAFAQDCDVLTFDHEHVPPDHLRTLEAEGVTVRPSAGALIHAQDKSRMRRRLADAGLPGPPWRMISTEEELREFGEQYGWPVVLKTPRGGYDGKGVRLVDKADEAADWFARGARLLAEQRVRFTREIAVLVARSPQGQAAAYPVVETVQAGGVCREVLAPAPITDDHAVAAQAAALRIAGTLDVTGMMTAEMFDTDAGVLVNELAMRPHNAGHWTIEGAVTSQFEQHLRAVLDLPLGSPALVAPHAVMANVLGGNHPDLYRGYLHCMARDPSLRIHVYAKGVRPGRKVAHVTVVGDDLAELRGRAQHAAAYLRGDIDG
jgi:5-(carboxyamino)imidazole ribonucleotide synthase